MNAPRHLLTCAAFGALVLAAFGSSPPEARAITFGQPDCVNNSMNDGCLHPNTVSLSGFRLPNEDELGVGAVSEGRCSGSLLRKDDERIVILTAGHCVSLYLVLLQSGQLIDVGVSFDAEIVRDVSVDPPLWTPAQYVLGGIPVLTEEFGPPGRAFNLQFDYAVVVFELAEGAPVTHDGTPVELSGVDPVALPPPGLLEDIVDAADPPVVTAVGYGVGEAHQKPGKGGRRGAPNDPSLFGMRYVATGTGLAHFMGVDANLVFGSQNPAREFSGSCFGDSGGPIFYDDGLGELQVGITSSGDAICRGSAIIARTDAPEVGDFLGCVLAAEDTAAIAACGCTEVGKLGRCAK